MGWPTKYIISAALVSLLFNNLSLHVNIKYAMSYVLVKTTLVTPYLSCITVAVVDTGVVTLVQPL